MENEGETRECPYCKELIKADAVKCKYCGSTLAPEQPPHGGVCPYCKEQINPEAVKCKHCKSWLIGPQSGDYRYVFPQERIPLERTAGHFPPVGPDRTQPVTTAQMRGTRLNDIIVILGGPADPGDPLPCEGHYEAFIVCLPYIGCTTVYVWVCLVV